MDPTSAHVPPASPPPGDAFLEALRRSRLAVHRAYLDLCQAVAYAAVRQPAALPDLLESYRARHDEREVLDFLIAIYAPQNSLSRASDSPHTGAQ